jgi:hypothetical protein
MSQTISFVETLGKQGLLERLDNKTREQGTFDKQILVDLVRDKKYERVQGIGDDFIPDSDLYNAIGSIYPLLDRKQKDEVIRAHLNQFDGLNYLAVNSNHTPNIREPLLLTDIAIARPLYWPGLNDEKRFWDGKETFTELQKEIMGENGLFDPAKVKSDFLVAYALMRKDFTFFGEDYVKAANPEFLERVLKGIVALRFANLKDESQINERINRLYQLLPSSVHDRIEPFRKERDWTYSEQFR